MAFVKYTFGMKKDVVPIEIRGILPANAGCAVFVGNDEKVFVIQVEHNMGAVIGMFLRNTPKERPLTHDLIARVFEGFNITVERVVITELKNSTYYARLILQQQNELGRKIVEIDARPSDCIAIATAQKKPIYVSASLFEQVEDMSEVLERINGDLGVRHLIEREDARVELDRAIHVGHREAESFYRASDGPWVGRGGGRARRRRGGCLRPRDAGDGRANQAHRQDERDCSPAGRPRRQEKDRHGSISR